MKPVSAERALSRITALPDAEACLVEQDARAPMNTALAMVQALHCVLPGPPMLLAPLN